MNSGNLHEFLNCYIIPLFHWYIFPRERLQRQPQRSEDYSGRRDPQGHAQILKIDKNKKSQTKFGI